METLHECFSTEEAIAAFRGDASSESFCDGQFIVLPKVILCFCTVGDPDLASHMSTPTRFVWRPERMDYAPDDSITWFPEKIREVWDRSQKPIRRLRDHHLFLRTPSDEQFFYAGQVHLGSFGGYADQGVSGVSASFTLANALPRDAWLKFSGYAGWLVDVNHDPVRIAFDDSTTFEQLIGRMLQQEFSHLTMTRYEEDSLTVYTNANRGWLMYLRNPGDSGIYAQDNDYCGEPDDEELFECVCGIDLEYPAVETVPRELALRAAQEFFATGRLPECVRWA